MRDASATIINTTTPPLYKDDRKEPCDDVIPGPRAAGGLLLLKENDQTYFFK